MIRCQLLKLIILIFVMPLEIIYAQNHIKLGPPIIGSRGIYSIFSITSKDSTRQNDSIVRVVRIFKNENLLLTYKIISVHIGNDLSFQILGLEARDTSLNKFLQNKNELFPYERYRVQLVNSSGINDQGAIEDELSINKEIDNKKSQIDMIKGVKPSTIDSMVLSQKTISIHGNISLIGQMSDSKYLGQSVPQNYLRTQINSEISLFGVPLNMSYYNTTENNIELNKINNFKISFNYELFYNNIKKKLDERMNIDKSNKLNKLTNINIIEINKEYSKLLSQINEPDFQKQILKLKSIIQKGVTDSLFRRSYRFKKAENLLAECQNKLDRLKDIEKLREIYFKNIRSVDLSNAIDDIKASTVSALKSNIKKYGISKPGYSYLLSVKKLDLGTFDPNYTTLVLSGVSLTGINTEINPGLFYGALTWGTTVNNFANPFSKDINGGRSIFAVRAGIGRTESMLLSVSVLKGTDYSDNVVKDTNYSYYLPQSNYVIGGDFKYKFQKNYEAGFEYAKSMNEEIAKETKNSTEQLSSLVNPNQSKYSNAWLAYMNANIEETGTKISLLTRVIDPFFYSFGTPYLRKDNFKIEAKTEQTILKKQITASLRYRRDEDNIYQLKEGTAINNTFIYTLNIKFKNYPFLILTYSPNYQSTFDAIRKQQFSSKVLLYNITAGYTKQNKKVVSTSIANYSKQYNSTSNSELSRFHVDQFSFNESIYLKKNELNFSFSSSYALPYLRGDTGRTISISEAVSKTFAKRKITINTSYSYQKDFVFESRKIITAGINLSPGWDININFRAEHHFIQSFNIQSVQKYSEMNLGRITLIKAF